MTATDQQMKVVRRAREWAQAKEAAAVGKRERLEPLMQRRLDSKAWRAECDLKEAVEKCPHPP